MWPIFGENVCPVQPFRRKAKNGLRSIMRTSPISSRNVCFVQPFYGMWPKPQTFSQKGEKWTEIDLSEWVLYFAKTDALSNHLTAWGSTTDFFAECRKMDWNRSMRMRPIFSKNVCFVQPFYGMWPKPQTFSQKGEKWTEIDLSEWVLYFAKTDALSNHLTAWGSTTDFFAECRKMDWNRSMRMRPIFSKNVCFAQPFYGMWPKPQTFSQNGENWTKIDLCEWVLYFAKTHALCNHFTACGPN